MLQLLLRSEELESCYVTIRNIILYDLPGEFLGKFGAWFSYNFLQTQILNILILCSVSTIQYRNDKETFTLFHTRSSICSTFPSGPVDINKENIPVTPKIFQNPRIKQLTMALWSIAAPLDLEYVALVKRHNRSNWNYVM
jgi:hypothetical protein